MSLEEHPRWHVTMFPAQWEYKRIVDDRYTNYEKEIDEAGMEGWELVAVLPRSEEYYETSVFKRPVHPGTKSQDNDASAQA